MIKYAILTALCLAMQAGFAQDVVTMRNGQRYTGEILEQQKKELTFHIADQDQTVVIPRSQVLSFDYDHTSDFQGSISWELFFGGTFISPSSSIKNALNQIGYGYDESAGMFGSLDIFSTSYKYPHVNNQPVLGISMYYAPYNRSELGLAFSFRTADVEGRTFNKAYTHVGYNFYQLTPVYRRYTRYHQTYFEAGLPLNIFQLHEGGDTNKRNLPAVLNTGIKVGTGFYLSKKQLSGLQLKMNLHCAFSDVDVDDLQQSTQDQSFETFTLFKGKSIFLHTVEIGIVYHKWNGARK
jgi:hypothetical protein